ncbi:hypothetical protein [Amycolatopsis magusensis]|uniref:hypothetical protein n=1 Tax=Amycolatopsis magusensis TaxID=882444 RepID=UPI00378995A9
MRYEVRGIVDATNSGGIAALRRLVTKLGVYRKNAWVAHVHGVRPDADRHDPSLSLGERDSFRNLLLHTR